MPGRRLVLASASPARRRLLADAGFAPEVVVSGVDESGIGADGWEAVRALAELKAMAVAKRDEVGGAVVIGCDSMLLFDGELWGRAADRDEASARWRRLRDRTGVLLTGHCVVDTATGRVAQDVGDTVVHFGSPTDDEIAAYAATDEALQVAGPFTIDGRAAPFVERIEGDPGNVIGLSLPLFRRLLGELDIEVTSLWS